MVAVLDDWGPGPLGSTSCSPCTPGFHMLRGPVASACSQELCSIWSHRAPRTHAHVHAHDWGSPRVGTDSKTCASKEEVAGWSVGNLSIDGLSQPSLWPPHVQVLRLPHAAEVCTSVCQAALQTKPWKQNGLWLLRRFYTSLQIFTACIFCPPPYAIGNA